MSASSYSRELLGRAAAVAEELGGVDLVGIDVSGPLPFSDAFLIVTGGSERGVTAIARRIEATLESFGADLLRREGRDAGRWALLDFGDLVVHVFHEEERAYYDLERLWRDCPAIPVDAAESHVLVAAAAHE